MPDDGYQRARLGCAGSLAVFNIVSMGSLASIFAAGPYSSVEQAWWYRGGSIGLLIVGGIGPVLILCTIARRSARLTVALTLWMLIALVLLVGYVFNSGGGI
ncbi:hypothetical protein [uncultured Sphingomonas sp.]|uniref:hypothetical protein n=1 Tax=uncultured Sphingomonas sp. TaxID=158754 RepID=UPI0035C9CE68